MSHKQCYEKREEIKKQLEAAQVRIKELEAWAKADRDYESMDCPHESEHRCDCGLISNELWAKCRALRETALEREGGSVKNKIDVRSEFVAVLSLWKRCRGRGPQWTYAFLRNMATKSRGYLKANKKPKPGMAENHHHVLSKKCWCNPVVIKP